MRKKWFIFTTAIFLTLLVWRGVLFLNEDADWYQLPLDIWGGSYQFVALASAMYCFITARKWGVKTTLAQVLLLLGLGLIGQVFGQVSYAYLTIKHLSYYPSIGDIGYFLSMMFYIAAAYKLLFTAGYRQISNSKQYTILGFVSWLIILALSYWLFLHNHDYTGVNLITRILDFGYPFGESMYAMLSFTAVLLASRYLGGLLFRPVLLLSLAFFAQYISDFTFLFLQTRDLWNGGYTNDLMFAFSYYIIALSIFILDHHYYRVTK